MAWTTRVGRHGSSAATHANMSSRPLAVGACSGGSVCAAIHSFSHSGTYGAPGTAHRGLTGVRVLQPRWRVVGGEPPDGCPASTCRCTSGCPFMESAPTTSSSRRSVAATTRGRCLRHWHRTIECGRREGEMN
jgi:hypothetical protein